MNTSQPGIYPDVRTILIRIIIMLASGTATVAAVGQELNPVLLFLAGSGGGIVASLLYGKARNWQRLHAWYVAHLDGSSRYGRIAAQVVAWMIYRKETAALVVALLGAVLSAIATAALAVASGASLNAAWAAGVAFLASQLLYLSKQASLTDARPVSVAPPTEEMRAEG